MEIVNKSISELIEAEYNPRRLTKDQYKQLKDSLLRFGVVDPVLVNINEDRKNIIIGGHQRTRVWSDLGNDSIPCVELNLSLEQEKELNVRLNKNTGEFDFDMLANYFNEDELIDWGFEAFQFDTEADVDYSILDDEDLEEELNEMNQGVKKAIQIEFDLDSYEEAKELVKYWRDKEANIGEMIIEFLKSEKLKL
jgi:ParB-like chromosome segregation protein Spo0J